MCVCVHTYIYVCIPVDNYFDNYAVLKNFENNPYKCLNLTLKNVYELRILIISKGSCQILNKFLKKSPTNNFPFACFPQYISMFSDTDSKITPHFYLFIYFCGSCAVISAVVYTRYSCAQASVPKNRLVCHFFIIAVNKRLITCKQRIGACFFFCFFFYWIKLGAFVIIQCNCTGWQWGY